MTIGTPITCPHCGAANVAGAQFCESCGKALPSAIPSGPRVVSADSLPQSAIGQRLVSDELVKTQKSASNALLVVAIISSVVAAILVAIMQSPAARRNLPPLLMIVQVGIAVIFWGLWFWSRKAPLPATIVGLVLYATLVVLNVISAVSQLSSNPESRGNGIGGIGVGWLDIVIIALLAKGIGAGLKHKRMLQTGAVA